MRTARARMTIDDIEVLVRRGESETVEFKENDWLIVAGWGDGLRFAELAGRRRGHWSYAGETDHRPDSQ